MSFHVLRIHESNYLKICYQYRYNTDESTSLFRDDRGVFRGEHGKGQWEGTKDLPLTRRLKTRVFNQNRQRLTVYLQ